MPPPSNDGVVPVVPQSSAAIPVEDEVCHRLCCLTPSFGGAKAARFSVPRGSAGGVSGPGYPAETSEPGHRHSPGDASSHQREQPPR